MLKQWKERGVTAINLGPYIGKQGRRPEPEHQEMIKAPFYGISDKELNEYVNEVERRYQLAKKAGLADKAYLYLFDECLPIYRGQMNRVVNALKERMPDLRLVTTASFYNKAGKIDFGAADGLDIDTWVPIIQHFRDPNLVDIGNSFGRDVWWYICSVPVHDVYLDDKAMDARMLTGLMPRLSALMAFSTGQPNTLHTKM